MSDIDIFKYPKKYDWSLSEKKDSIYILEFKSIYSKYPFNGSMVLDKKFYLLSITYRSIKEFEIPNKYIRVGLGLKKNSNLIIDYFNYYNQYETRIDFIKTSNLFEVINATINIEGANINKEINPQIKYNYSSEFIIKAIPKISNSSKIISLFNFMIKN